MHFSFQFKFLSIFLLLVAFLLLHVAFSACCFLYILHISFFFLSLLPKSDVFLSLFFFLIYLFLFYFSCCFIFCYFMHVYWVLHVFCIIFEQILFVYWHPVVFYLLAFKHLIFPIIFFLLNSIQNISFHTLIRCFVSVSCVIVFEVLFNQVQEQIQRHWCWCFWLSSSGCFCINWSDRLEKSLMLKQMIIT